MPTTITKSIGTSSRNYSTIQLFEDALPSDITAAGTDEVWVGECYNDSEFSAGTTFAGTTVDSTHYIEVTTAAGESFIDDASASTNPLRYDQSKGVGVRPTGSYVIPFNVASQAEVRINNLQIKRSNVAGNVITISSTGAKNNRFYENLLIHHQDASTAVNLFGNSGNVTRIVNSLIIQEATGNVAIGLGGYSEARNCTFVCPSDVTSTATGLAFVGSNGLAINCAVFGFNSCYTGTARSGTGYICTDDSSAPGSNNQVSKTYANQFEGTATSGLDFRLKSGSDCEANGTPDTTYTSDLDIIGQSRDVSTPDIGAWEYSAAAASTASPLRFGSFSLLGMGI